MASTQSLANPSILHLQVHLAQASAWLRRLSGQLWVQAGGLQEHQCQGKQLWKAQLPGWHQKRARQEQAACLPAITMPYQLSLPVVIPQAAACCTLACSSTVHASVYLPDACTTCAMVCARLLCHSMRESCGVDGLMDKLVNLRSSCRGHDATTSCTHILHYAGIKGKHACACACKTVDLQQL